MSRFENHLPSLMIFSSSMMYHQEIKLAIIFHTLLKAVLVNTLAQRPLYWSNNNAACWKKWSRRAQMFVKCRPKTSLGCVCHFYLNVIFIQPYIVFQTPFQLEKNPTLRCIVTFSWDDCALIIFYQSTHQTRFIISPNRVNIGL